MHFNRQIGQLNLALGLPADGDNRPFVRLGTYDFTAIGGARNLADKEAHAALTSRKTR